jgi:hypothetical protein
MAELRLAFRLPLEPSEGSRPPAQSASGHSPLSLTRLPERAEFVSDYGLRGGRLFVDGALALEARTRAELEEGVTGALPDARRLRVVTEGDELCLFVDGVAAPREDRLSAPTARSAWIHAWLALSGSLFGFVASWLYVRRAAHDPWAMKMAVHMAAWHLFLVLTLFPASVWGQRIGIRAVQLASLVFFCIHVGIALANTGETDWIGVLNGASGVMFGVTVVWGQRAWRDMDPIGSGIKARASRRPA